MLQLWLVLTLAVEMPEHMASLLSFVLVIEESILQTKHQIPFAIYTQWHPFHLESVLSFLGTAGIRLRG